MILNVDCIKLRDKLVELRKRQGWTRPEVAAGIQMDYSAYYKIEVSETRSPGLSALASLSKLYGISVDELLEGTYDD